MTVLEIEQHSDMRHHGKWQVRVGDDMYVLHAVDSEDAAWRVAHHLDPQLPVDDEETWMACMHFRDKSFSTCLQIPDGRSVISEPFGYVEGLGT